MKKAFALLLIFATISVLFGQDLNYQLDSLNEEYEINIKGNIIDAINQFFGCEITIKEDNKD